MPPRPDTSVPTLGVEEEYLLVAPETGAPVPAAERVRERAAARTVLGDREVQHELLQAQVEVATPVCSSLDEVDGHLRRLRGALAAAAEECGCRLAACASAAMPLDHPSTAAGPAAAEALEAAVTEEDAAIPVTAEPRYERMRLQARRLVDEQLINGMHVHVAVPDRAAGVRIVNRMRPWLPLLLALSANSPLWLGHETGFASWRHVVFGRWPVSGMPPLFADADDYDRRVRRLVDAGLIDDTGQVYWAVRVSERFPTVEVRVADVQLRVDDAVLLAGLVRALVMTLRREPSPERAVPEPEPEWLNAALWQAARHGLGGRLADPLSGTLRPASEVVADALAHLTPALDAAGDTARVADALHHTLTHGNGATRQRAALAASGPEALRALLLAHHPSRPSPSR